MYTSPTPSPSQKMCNLQSPSLPLPLIHNFVMSKILPISYIFTCAFDNFDHLALIEVDIDMRHIQYQGETLPPFPLVLAFHLVLGKFHI